MNLIKEKSNQTNITRYYNIGQTKTIDEAVVWISDIRKIESISTDYIYLCDLNNRSDEESESVQLDANVSLTEMKKYMNDSSIDLIFLNGKFNKHPMVVGVKIHEQQAYITIRKKDPADISALEAILNLL